MNRFIEHMRRKGRIIAAASIISYLRLDEWASLHGTVRLPFPVDKHGVENGILISTRIENRPQGMCESYLFIDGNINALVYLDNEPYYAVDEYTRLIPLPRVPGEISVSLKIFPQGIVGQEYGSMMLRDAYLVCMDQQLLKLSMLIESIIELYQGSDGELREKMLRILEDIDKSIWISPLRPINNDIAVRLYGGVYSAYPMLYDELLRLSIRDPHRLEEYGHRGRPEPENPVNVLQHVREALDQVKLLYPKHGRLHTVMHSHIDAAWLWRIEDTSWKLAKTMAKTITLLKNYPSTTAVLSTTYFLDLLYRDYPAIYRETIDLIKKGRIIPVAGMWVESDVYIIPSESLVRQFLYGQRILRERTGKYAWIGWLPDSFGFSANLPQIMRQAGIGLFVTHKPIWNDTNKFPYDTFNWEGINGERIPVHVITGELAKNGNLGSIISYWKKYREKSTVPARIYTYGYCNGGSGPTHEMIERLEISNELPGTPLIIHGELESFYGAIKKNIDKLPVHKGEIYVEYHRGSYTTNTCIKHHVWLLDYLLRIVEQLRTWLMLEGKEYPESNLEDYWKKLLLAEFHDILSGTITNNLSREICRILDETIEKVHAMISEALTDIIGPSRGIIIYNPILRERREVVLIGGGESARAIYVEVPPVGYRCLPEEKIRMQVIPGGYVKITEEEDGFHVENEHLEVIVSRSGTIKSIRDKHTETEYLSRESNVLTVSEDLPGEWDAWNIDKTVLSNTKRLDGETEGFKIIDNMVAELGFTYRYGDSVVKQTVVIRSGSRRIDFHTIFDWRDKWRLVKAWFYPSRASREYYCDTQFGYVERSAENEAMYEVPMISWCYMGDKYGGIGVISPFKHGVSVRGGGIGLSLLKSPVLPDPMSDNGRVEVDYSIYPVSGDDPVSEVQRSAEETVNPLYILRTRGSGEPRGESGSLLELVEGNALITALKKRYKDRGVILRLYNPSPKPSHVCLKLGFHVDRAIRTTILEDRMLGELQIHGDTAELDLGPFQVATILLEKHTME